MLHTHQKSIYFCHRTRLICLNDYTQCSKSLHIQFFATNKELFICLLSGCITLRIYNRILHTIRTHLCRYPPSFLIICTSLFSIPKHIQETITNSRKRHHLLFLKFREKISPFCPNKQANIQICPLSSGETKYRFTSEGATNGCFFITRSIKLAGSEPLENATFAKRAVVTLNFEEYDMIKSSIILLLAPITFTGLAALSVDTQKKCCGGNSANKSKRRRAFSTLFSNKACTAYLSFSLRTCLWAEKLATISNPFSSLKICSNIGSAKFNVYALYSSGTYKPYVDRKSRVSSARPFSFKSTTTNFEGLKGNMALINEEPMEPAPPITNRLFPFTSFANRSRFCSISGKNKLSLRPVTYVFTNSPIFKYIIFPY